MGITLPSFTSASNAEVVEAMDYNYVFSNDKLTSFMFKPDDLQKLVAGSIYSKYSSAYTMRYSFTSVVLST